MDFARSALETINDLRTGGASPASLAADALDRIEAIDATGYELNSILALAPKNDGKGFNPDSPLAGLPIVIKDNIESAPLKLLLR